MLKDKKIALYVTGGIAIYKTVDLMRSFIKAGAQVRVAMTESATRFVTPMTFQILSRNYVHVDTFREDDPTHVAHIDLSDWADLAVVAPATTNTIAKITYGIGDNFVTSSLLAFRKPIFVVPAMNTNMYQNDITQENIKKLSDRGLYVMEPATGFLAEGYEGKGRYPDNELILEELDDFILSRTKNLPLRNVKIVVSAGGTKERIDPVRYITNDSSGKTGHAIAQIAYENGADVTLVTTSDLKVPKAIHTIKIDSAKEMYDAIDNIFGDTDVLIMSAAVSDYRVENPSDSKTKKTEESDQLTIKLKENPDILKTMGNKKKDQILIGFAAETENVEKYAKKKLIEKNLDMIIANDVSREDTGFNVDDNQVTIYTKDHQKLEIPKTSKENIANVLINKLNKIYS